MKEEQKSICKTENFKKIFAEHSRVLRNYIYYKCGDSSLAEDIVQEAFIKLWENCKKVHYENSLFFLKRTSKNVFLNIVKHQKVVLKHKQLTKDKTNYENPEFIMEEKEFGIKLDNAIANLPEKEREVFLLNRIDKKKYAEIAVFLNISIKTVEKRMHNALKMMKKEIGKI